VSLISPLNRVLGLGSAKGGTEHWWTQRLTAVALIPLGLWLIYSLTAVDVSSYNAVVVWLRQPISGIFLTLAAVTIIYHSYLGVQIVIEDYVHGHSIKVVALVGSTFAHIFLLAAAVFSILKVAFGAA
jgi:succinate dehydrogenase / fumarate reductase membrane anchor subunit